MLADYWRLVKHFFYVASLVGTEQSPVHLCWLRLCQCCQCFQGEEQARGLQASLRDNIIKSIYMYIYLFFEVLSMIYSTFCSGECIKVTAACEIVEMSHFISLLWNWVKKVIYSEWLEGCGDTAQKPKPMATWKGPPTILTAYKVSAIH